MTTLPAVRSRSNLTSGDLPRTAAKRAPARSYDYEPLGPSTGVLVTTVGKVVTGYTCTEFGCDLDGRAFELAKLFGGSDKEATTYHVFVARNQQDHSCDCKGHQYHGHCTHHDALVELIRRGALDPLTEVPAEPFPHPSQVAADAALDEPAFYIGLTPTTFTDAPF